MRMAALLRCLESGYLVVLERECPEFPLWAHFERVQLDSTPSNLIKESLRKHDGNQAAINSITSLIA